MPDNESTTKFKVDISELKKSMQEARREIELANSEFKAVSSALDDWSTSTDGVSARLKQLNSNSKSQKKILDALEKQYAAVAERQGASSKEAQNLQIKINKQKAVVNTTEKEIRKYTSVLERLEAGSENAADGIDDLSDSARKSKSGLGVMDIAAGNLAAGGISAVINKGIDAVKTLADLSEETREYREDMAKLETAFKTGNHTAEDAYGIYEDFYALLGESDRSVEAVNHLAELTDSTEDLSKWQKIAAGVTAKFGDSLPLEGLTEAANETAKVGKVTGPLADAINWVKLSNEQWTASLGGNQKAQEAFNKAVKEGEAYEDAYSAALGVMTSEQERAKSITELLTLGYSAAGDEYNKTTSEMQNARRETAEMERAQARLGEALEPISSGLNKVKSAFINFGANIAEKFIKTSEATKILTDEQEALIEKSELAAEKLDELNSIADEKAKSSETEINYTKNLVDELSRLADENGRVNDIDKARVNFILGELNSAYGTEYQMVGNVINNYDNLKESIYKTIEAKRAQILLAAYEEEYKEAVLNSKEAVEAQARQASVLVEKEEELIQKKAELSEAQKNYDDKASESSNHYKQILAGKVTAAEGTVERIEAELEKERERYNELSEDVKKNQAAIDNYEINSGYILAGETQKAIENLNLYSDGHIATAGTVSDATDAQIQALSDAAVQKAIILGIMKNNYAEKQGEMTEEQKKQMEARIDEAKKEASAAAEKFAVVGGDAVKGLVQGAVDTNGNPVWNLAGKLAGFVKDALRSTMAAADEHSPSKKTMVIGDFLTKGLIIGAKKDSKKFNKTMAGIMEGGIKAQEKAAEINSPAKREEEIGKMLMLGLSKGIDENGEYVLDSLDRLNDDMLASEQFYKSEKERIDKERDEAEYQERLKNAKSAEEITKIKNERIEKENKEAQDDYIKDLEDTAKKERKIIDDTFKNVEKSLDDFVGNAFDKIEEFEDLREKIVESFFDGGENGLTYQTVSIVGGGMDLSFKKLADVSADNDILKAYNNSLDSLIERFGSIPDEVSGYLSEMSLEDAQAYVEALLASSDVEYKKYTDSLAERSELAREISKKTTAGQGEDLKNDILEGVSTLPDEIAKIGKESGVSFTGGFLENLNKLIDGIGQSLRDEFIEMGIDGERVFSGLGSVRDLSTSVQSASDTINNSNETTVYNYTQNIYSPKHLPALELYRISNNTMDLIRG